jgi:hypothetical protein
MVRRNGGPWADEHPGVLHELAPDHVRPETSRHVKWFLVALGAAGIIGFLALGLISAMFASTIPQTAYANAAPSAIARGDIPADYFRAYQQVAARYRLDWAILAAIGSIETDHGRLKAPGVTSGVNAFGCCAGPMQFNIRNGNPSTWEAYREHPDDSPYNPEHAIPAAARLLIANGAPDNYERAILAYNHAQWYVIEVLEKAARYRATPEVPAGDIGDISATGGCKAIVDRAYAVAREAGGPTIYVGSDLRPGSLVGSGAPSDHSNNNTTQAARDIGKQGVDLIMGPPAPELDTAVVAVGQAFGRDWQEAATIIDSFQWRGYRLQGIWRTPAYGGHLGHLHFGCRKA